MSALPCVPRRACWASVRRTLIGLPERAGKERLEDPKYHKGNPAKREFVEKEACPGCGTAENGAGVHCRIAFLPELLCRVRLRREGHERQRKPDAEDPQATDLVCRFPNWRRSTPGSTSGKAEMRRRSKKLPSPTKSSSPRPIVRRCRRISRLARARCWRTDPSRSIRFSPRRSAWPATRFPEFLVRLALRVRSLKREPTRRPRIKDPAYKGTAHSDSRIHHGVGGLPQHLCREGIS